MIFRKNKMPVRTAMAVVMLALAARAQVTNGQHDADQKEFHDYVLTMDKINRLAGTQKDFEALQKSNPEMAKDMNGADSNGKSIDQLAQQLNKYPQAIAVLKKNGFGAREYIVGTATLIQASMAVGFKRAGTYKEYPPQILKQVSQANLTFIEQHWDDITKTMPAFSGGGASQGK